MLDRFVSAFREFNLIKIRKIVEFQIKFVRFQNPEFLVKPAYLNKYKKRFTDNILGVSN